MTENPQRWLFSRSWFGWLAMGLALAAVINAGWWVVLANPLDSAPSGDEVTIPDGTAAAIQAGTPFLFAPERLALRPGGRMRVVNEDSVAHTVGATSIPPGATGDVVASESGELSCTIHPEGHIEITLGSRPPLLGMGILAGGACLATLVAGWTLRPTPPA